MAHWFPGEVRGGRLMLTEAATLMRRERLPCDRRSTTRLEGGPGTHL